MYYKIIGTLAGLAVLLFLYYQFTGLIERTAKLTEQVNIQEQTIKQQAEFIEQQAVRANELSESLIQSQQTLDRYMLIFEKHDLGVLSYNKPGLIQNRINNATSNLLKEIDSETSN